LDPGSTFVEGWTAVRGTNGTFTQFVAYMRDDGNPFGGRDSQDPGGYFVELGYFFGMNGIQQTFSTAPNQLYKVIFWAATDPFNGPPGQLHVSAGQFAGDFTAEGSSSFFMRWREHSFLFMSDASGLTTLTFQNGGGTLPCIDTISVHCASIVPEPSPVLRFVPSATALTVRWSACAPNFVMEATASLSPPVQWQAVTNAIRVFGTEFEVSLAYDSERRFFRLRKPSE